ncbi:TVP38/TMEM64 family protein [Candidatus Pacearchaeota archaeon]|nr:TVP38/TMEM64 family protein [Candidatus Pacearchaeota archaeon]
MPKKREILKADKSIIKFRTLLIIFLAFFAFSVYLSANGVDIKETFNYLIKSPHAGWWFILLYIATSFVPLPFAPTSFVGALLFPFSKAFFYTMAGSLLFSIIMFYIARVLGREYVRNWTNKHEKYKHIVGQINRGRMRDLIMIRFFFILPAEFVNVMYGLSEIKFGRYFVGTLLGNIPVIFFSIMLVRSRLAHNELNVILALVGLGLLLLIPLFTLANIRKCFKSNKKNC